MAEHKHFYPFCQFILGQNVGNIPLGEETGPQNIPEKEDQAEEDRETVTNREAGKAGDTQEEAEEDLELALALSLSLSLQDEP